MLSLDQSATAAALPYSALIEALAQAFAGDTIVPPRQHYDVPVANESDAALMLMPAWQSGEHIGVKVVTVFPDNSKRDLPAVFGSYLLMSARTGQPIASLDGTELTLRRTAAASALASGYLSRKNSKKLLMVGTGSLAPHLIEAHATARPIAEVCIWGRRTEAANRLAGELSASSLKVSVASNLEQAVGEADLISCATLASEPLIKGAWLAPGQHLDLVGAFGPDMAEADNAALSRADVYVDTRAGAMTEAGEILQAIDNRTMTADDIKASLRELVTGAVPGRQSDETITLFKSVGTALEDLAAAKLAMRNHCDVA